LPHLLEICAAAVARHEVRFEARPLERLHSALEVIGNKLHELLAGQVIDIVSHSKDLSDLVSRRVPNVTSQCVMSDGRREAGAGRSRGACNEHVRVETNPLWPHQSQEEILT
jgi:hypothetical protein